MTAARCHSERSEESGGRRVPFDKLRTGSSLILSETKPSFPAQLSAPEWTRILLALITLVGLTLRAWNLDLQGMTLDEAVTQYVSTHPLMQSLSQYLDHLPFYFAVMHCWASVFGASEVMIRVPSVLFGTCCIPITYVVARRLAGEGSALVAAATLALSPYAVHFSREARMYSLLLLLTGLGLYCLIDWIQSARWRSMLGFALASLLAFYSHYTGVYLAVGGLLASALTLRPPDGRRRLAAWLTGMILIVAGIVPGVLRLLFAVHHFGKLKPEFSGTRGVSAPFMSLVDFTTNASRNLLGSGWEPLALLLTLAFVVLGVLGAVRVSRVRGGEAILGVCAVTLGGGTVLAMRTVYAESRYFMVAFLPAVVLAAMGIAGLPRKARPVAHVLSLLFLATWGFSLGRSMTVPGCQNADWRGVVREVNRRYLPGDVALIPAAYHPILNAYADRPIPHLFLSNLEVRNGDLRFLTPHADAKRLWIIVEAYGPNPYGGMRALEPFVVKHGSGLETRHFNWIRLICVPVTPDMEPKKEKRLS